MNRARSAVLPASLLEQAEAGLVRQLGDFIRRFIVAAVDPYRPEQHYMRGPGPACRARETSE